ncbi:MAG: GTP cyclohydrolase II [Wenzhouxiangellaceae bacterium]
MRVHSACFTAEVVASLKCDCKQQLDYALSYIADHEGVVVYLPQEGRGIGLSNKIRAYALQEDGHDTIVANELLGLPIDDRRYDDAAAVLQDLGIKQLRLITNNPAKLEAMRDLGFSVDQRIPVPAITNRHSHAYLETKRQRMGHMLEQGSATGQMNGAALGQGVQRPFVHVNFALSPQGRMNQQNGDSIELSCADDWQRVHELRERYAAVVVGARTWNSDQPRLTARAERLGRQPYRQPDRVIFAGATDCSVKPGNRRTFVIGHDVTDQSHMIHIPVTDHDLSQALTALYHADVDSLLVEGGKTLLRSFIRQNMIDRLTIYVSTPSLAEARRAVAATFPELPIKRMSGVPLGRGTLLSYSRNDMTVTLPRQPQLAAVSASRA